MDPSPPHPSPPPGALPGDLARPSPAPPPEPVVRVVAAVVERRDRILLAQRRPDKRHGGLWEFPGGKVGPGETEEEALARELREELGVELLEVGECLFTAMDPGSPYRIRFWACRVEGEPRALEHLRVSWLRPEAAAGRALAPADARFLSDWLAREEGA